MHGIATLSIHRARSVVRGNIPGSRSLFYAFWWLASLHAITAIHWLYRHTRKPNSFRFPAIVRCTGVLLFIANHHGSTEISHDPPRQLPTTIFDYLNFFPTLHLTTLPAVIM